MDFSLSYTIGQGKESFSQGETSYDFGDRRLLRKFPILARQGLSVRQVYLVKGKAIDRMLDLFEQ